MCKGEDEGIMQQEAFIAIGRLTKPHGLHGEVVMLPYVYDLTLLPDLTDQPLLLRQGKDKIQERWVIDWRAFKKRLLLRLNACHDVMHAEALREWEVLIPRHWFPPLPPGEYYWFEIEGLTVYASDGQYIGTIAEIIYTGSNDVYVVRHDAHEVLVPALKDVVRAIDLEQGSVHLFPRPEILE
jgi:16S rRNA processing protein RimM